MAYFLDMISEWYARRYCLEDISKIENYDKAINDKINMWDCHHRREIDENKSQQQLKDEGLYYKRPASELIFILESDHHSLHMSGFKFSDEHRAKMSASLKGKSSWLKGKHLTEEHKHILSLSHKGQAAGTIWVNNGKVRIRVKPSEIPAGFVRGKSFH